MNDLRNGHGEPNKVDTAASAACVRSGAFALLLSLALLLLIPYWRDRPRYTALNQYVGSRIDLAAQMETLDDDPIWQNYKASNEAAESLPIAQLRDLKVDISDMGGIKIKQPQPQPLASSKNQKKAVGSAQPSAPTINSLRVNVFAEVPEAPRIVAALTNLNDANTLTRARQVSNYFNFQIARWGNKRGSLVYRNVMASSCTKKPLEVPPKGGQPPEFVPALTEEALLSCLTIRDAKELAHFEQPTISNPMELGGRIQPMIELSPGSLPREAIDPSIATLAAQILLFFVVMYFGAFSREAVASPTFPAPGTLFGAFSRSRWTLLVLLLALMTPLGTSLALAAATRKWLFAVPDLFISWAVLTVFVVLETKGYFHALNPRPFLPRYRPVQNATTMSAAATDESKSAEKNSPA